MHWERIWIGNSDCINFPSFFLLILQSTTFFLSPPAINSNFTFVEVSSYKMSNDGVCRRSSFVVGNIMHGNAPSTRKILTTFKWNKCFLSEPSDRKKIVCMLQQKKTGKTALKWKAAIVDSINGWNEEKNALSWWTKFSRISLSWVLIQFFTHVQSVLSGYAFTILKIFCHIKTEHLKHRTIETLYIGNLYTYFNNDCLKAFTHLELSLFEEWKQSV